MMDVTEWEIDVTYVAKAIVVRTNKHTTQRISKGGQFLAFENET